MIPQAKEEGNILEVEVIPKAKVGIGRRGRSYLPTMNAIKPIAFMNNETLSLHSTSDTGRAVPKSTPSRAVKITQAAIFVELDPSNLVQYMRLHF